MKSNDDSARVWAFGFILVALFVVGLWLVLSTEPEGKPTTVQPTAAGTVSETVGVTEPRASTSGHVEPTPFPVLPVQDFVPTYVSVRADQDGSVEPQR